MPCYRKPFCLTITNEKRAARLTTYSPRHHKIQKTKNQLCLNKTMELQMVAIEIRNLIRIGKYCI